MITALLFTLLATTSAATPPRSWIKGDQVYLASPEVCAVAAIAGELIDPRDWDGTAPSKSLPEKFVGTRAGLIEPAPDPAGATIERADHITDIPLSDPPGDSLRGEVLIVTGDDITTDDIVPATAEMLSNWANIDAVASFIFKRLDPEFPDRALAKGGGWIVGGANYGQGSSREHAAMGPMYMGVKGVIAKSFARIHKANLVNFGLLPLTFADPSSYEGVAEGDVLVAEGVHAGIDRGRFTVRNETRGTSFEVEIDLTDRERTQRRRARAAIEAPVLLELPHEEAREPGEHEHRESREAFRELFTHQHRRHVRDALDHRRDERNDDLRRDGDDREVLDRVRRRLDEQIDVEPDDVRDDEPDRAEHALEHQLQRRLARAEAQPFVDAIEEAIE